MANKHLIIDNPDLEIHYKALGMLLCTAQEYQSAMTRSVKHLDVSPLQVNMLHILSFGPKAGMTVNQIKSQMIEESPNVSRALNKLMDKGLIVKNRDLVDQRVVHIMITEQGRKLHNEADISMLNAFESKLTEAEYHQLYELLKKV